MNLIGTEQRASYVAAIDNLHDTFGREIFAVHVSKKPKAPLSDADDDYDFAHDHNDGPEEFDISSTRTSLIARIKYVDKQDKDYQLISKEINNISINYGIIRVKVRKDSCELISSADNIIVDGFNCNVAFTDRRHGLFDTDYCTFYLQRTP